MKEMFTVWWPDRGQAREDGHQLKAFDTEDAAAGWAHWYDYHSNDYAIVGGEIAEVMVAKGTREDANEPVRVTVSGEMTRSYRARGAA